MVLTFKKSLLLFACLWLWPCLAQAEDYSLDYHLDLTDAPAAAQVSLTVRQDRGQLRRVRFSATSDRFTGFNSRQGLIREGDHYVWHVPKEGGELKWRAPVTHARNGGAYDARLGKQWALFRGEDAFPAMASVALKGATSAARLFVDVPGGWTFQSAFVKDGKGYRIDNPARRFDRPTGWMIAGKLGVRFDRIAGVTVGIAAPLDNNVRRQDLLALFNWTLPDLARLFPSFPNKVLVVSAGDPFWRGGLSGPASLYMHADRPLISENGTSTLVHEMFHVGLARSAAKKSDWIIEGLAEYYSVEILRRSGTVTASRHAKTLRSLARWADKSGPLEAARSTGATTARAVGLFKALDTEIRTRTEDRKNLDDVVRLLSENSGPLDKTELMAAVLEVCGDQSEVLSRIR